MTRTWHVQTWIWHGLHLILALGAPLLLTILVGCMKAKEKKEDLGPEVSSDRINAALAGAMEKADLNTMAVGQYLDYAETRRIENDSTSITLGARRIQVLDRKDTTDQAQFTLVITKSVRLNDGTFETTSAEDALWLNKTAAAASIPPSLRAIKGAELNAQALAQSAATSTQPKRVAFHHFRESDSSLDVPAPVKARANCGGVSGCQLPVHFIQFDMVLWQDDTTYQKISMDFGFSGATPFLPFGSNFDQLTGALIVDCRSTYVPVDSRSVYVRDCSTLDDFQK